MSFRVSSMAVLCGRVLVGCAVALLATNDTLAEVAQEPLMNKSGKVKPNIALVLDTSGSMGKTCAFAPPLARTMIKNGISEAEYECNAVFGNAPFLRSPFNNTLYYDPQKTYGPGYTASGSPATNVSVDSSSVVTVYQPKEEKIEGQDKTIREKLESGSATIDEFKNLAGYDKLEITTTPFSANPFGKHQGNRRDCAGDPCTHEEERRNIANWRAAHGSRILAAKTGLAAAFARQADNFRLAYTTIYTPLSQAPPPANVMKDFGLAKTDFFAWLSALPISGATPLRTALNDAGAYYENRTSTGPWASTPWLSSTEEPEKHLSCRRSHTILITDGWWTDRNPITGDADATTWPALTHAVDKNITYQYDPTAKKNPVDAKDPVDARSLGKSDATDGKPAAACTIGSNCAIDTLADVAFKYWVTDLRDDLRNDASKGGEKDPPFWQNMTTHTVSFGVQGTLSDAEIQEAQSGTRNWPGPRSNNPLGIDDLRHAAHNGGGKFLMIGDAAQFNKDLGDLIGDIAGQQLSESGVAASDTALDANTRKFVPSYKNETWWGNLQKVKPGVLKDEQDVTEWQVIKTDKNGQPTGETTLPPPEARKIFVWVDAGKQAIDFTYANIDLAANKLKGGNNKLQMSSAANAQLVNFLRGDRTLESTIFRSRAAVLGDIVNSRPVFIKNTTDPKYEKLPKGTPGLDDYAAYRQAKKTRSEGVLLVGANDGMLHAFGENDGRELFAYVPRSVLGKMESLAYSPYTHTYLVDGPLTEADAYVAAGAPAGWRNLVTGTAGAGAKAVFALDATNPLAMNGKSVLWEINPDPAFPTVSVNTSASFQELGHVLAPVQSGVTQSGHWVSIFGNGYDSKSGKASLFVVETVSGKLLKEIKTDDAPNNGLGGVRLVLNSTQQIIGAYAGDLQGRVWKFDLSSATPDQWKLGNGGSALFTAQDTAGMRLPITAQPAVTERSDQAKYRPSYLVTVGTGKLLEAGDPASTTPVQAVYGLWDQTPFGNPGGEAIQEGQLEGVTLSPVTQGSKVSYKASYTDPLVTGIDWSIRRGWKISLQAFAGERTVKPLETYNKVVKIDTVAPQSGLPSCPATPSSAGSFFIDPLTGICRRGGTLDTNGDGDIDAKDDADVCGYQSLADGEDAVISLPLGFNSTTGKGTGQGNDPGLKVVMDGLGGRIFRSDNYDNSFGTELDCKDAGYAAAHPEKCRGKPGAAAILNRSWRQIFPRAH
jgi:type IV pilus assembly protein PilY1